MRWMLCDSLGFRRGDRGRLGGKQNGEARAFALGAGDIDAAAVDLDDPGNEAQAQPEAGDRFRLRVANPVKAVKNVRQILGRYSDARVLDDDLRPARPIAGTDADAHRSAARSVLDCV